MSHPNQTTPGLFDRHGLNGSTALGWTIDTPKPEALPDVGDADDSDAADASSLEAVAADLGANLYLQLVAGFCGWVILSESRRRPGFSTGATKWDSVQLSGGSEWLEASVGKRFPHNWGWDSLSSLSCRTSLPEAETRHQS